MFKARLRFWALIWELHTAGASRDEQILTSGAEIGALLVDGLGDGVLIECPGEDLETLRLMSFGLLQACALLPDRPCDVLYAP